jgi:hypothetical protein
MTQVVQCLLGMQKPWAQSTVNYQKKMAVIKKVTNILSYPFYHKISQSFLKRKQI